MLPRVRDPWFDLSTIAFRHFLNNDDFSSNHTEQKHHQLSKPTRKEYKIHQHVSSTCTGKQHKAPFSDRRYLSGTALLIADNFIITLQPSPAHTAAQDAKIAKLKAEIAELSKRFE